MVGSGHHQILNVILIDGLHTLDSLAATVLAFEIIRGHTLDITQIGHGNNHVLLRNQILHGQIKFVKADAGPAIVAVFICNYGNLFLDDAQQLFLICQNSLQVINLLHQRLIFCLQLLPFQTGQCTQTHIYDSLCLYIVQFKAIHQLLLRLRRRPGAADNPDYFVDMIQGNQQTL